MKLRGIYCCVCNAPTGIAAGGCTNGCCAKCHRVYCTESGDGEHGHALNLGAARIAEKRKRALQRPQTGG
jgi:hypothetical protein